MGVHGLAVADAAQEGEGGGVNDLLPLPATETEAHIQAACRLAIGREPHVRLFRNNVGEAWHGRVANRSTDALTLLRPTRIVYGLCDGSSDLIGWTTVTITPEMVGQRVAVFTAGEVKRPGVTVPAHQERFLDAVRAAGGRAGVIRSAADAKALVRVP